MKLSFLDQLVDASKHFADKPPEIMSGAVRRLWHFHLMAIIAESPARAPTLNNVCNVD